LKKERDCEILCLLQTIHFVVIFTTTS